MAPTWGDLLDSDSAGTPARAAAPPAAAAPPSPQRSATLAGFPPGRWSRRAAPCYSATCHACRGRAADVVKAQVDEAALTGCAEEAAACIETTGDQMGLHEQLGTEGPNATCFCLFCAATLTKDRGTTQPGWPQLRRVPCNWNEPTRPRAWASFPFRTMEPWPRFQHYVTDDSRGAAATPEPRSLAGMIAWTEKFKAAVALAREGRAAQITTAKDYQSNKHGPLFTGGMSLLQLLGAMTLHLDLGIGKDLHDDLQAALKQLDKVVASHGGAREHELSEHIKQKEEEIAKWKSTATEAAEAQQENEAFIRVLQATQDKERAAAKAAKQAWHASAEQKEEISTRNIAISRAKQSALAAARALKVVEPELKVLRDQRDRGEGPFIKALLDVMGALGVERQKYHSQAFVGDDISRLFRDDATIRSFTSLLGSRTVLCADGVERAFGDDDIADAWFILLSDFGRCRRLYSRVSPLCPHEQWLLDWYVEDFQCSYARIIGKKPTPKNHILGYHILEIVQLKGSTGLLNESMCESAHAAMNLIQRKGAGVRGRANVLNVTAKRVAEASACEDLGAQEHTSKKRAREGKRAASKGKV